MLAMLFPLLPTACRAPEPVEPLDYSRPLAPGEKALVKVAPQDYPDFGKGYRNLAPLLQAVDRSIEYMKKPSAVRHFPVEGISHDRVARSLEAFRETLLNSRSAREFAREVKRRFDLYMSTGCDQRGTVLFTGYCEPIIPASLDRTARFDVPLYRLPDDLVKNEEGVTLGRRTEGGRLVPYYTRREIDRGGALEGRGLELAWVEHPLDAYIIHVQGSATLKLPDGSSKKIGYAGKNGRPYRSLGQALVQDGRIAADRVSLDSIRRYFRDQPGELEKYLFRNESYIFFTENEGGPYGSIGVEVTPYCTIATDKSVFPRASVTFLDTKLPAMTRRGSVALNPYQGFALDQDTGGAIRSAGRVDVFLGTGKDAEFLAGRTRCEGKLYYLFIK
jgi:membrane-bound lytic murein transglycosylase A